MSNLSAIEWIAERSEATPGLWNRRYSTISDNFAALNSNLTFDASGGTFSLSSNLSIGADLWVRGSVLVGEAPSVITRAELKLVASSAVSDYILFEDSSAAKSSYLLGSRVGGTADGLNLWDVSGDTMIVGFSKQSTKFYSPVVGTFFDLGGQVFNVKSFGAIGNGIADDTTAIQDAVTFAAGRVVYIPAGTYLITSSISRVVRSHNTNVPGLKIFGDGMHATVIDSRVTDGFAIVLDSTFTRAFQWGGYVRDLTITNSSSVSTTGGVYLTGAWEFACERVRIASLTTSAIYVPERLDLSADVDDYATYYATIANCVIELNRGWGINGEVAVGFNATIEANQIGSNQGGGIYIAGHHTNIRNNSIFDNGNGSPVDVLESGGVFINSDPAGPAGIRIHSNEFDSDHSYSIRAVGLVGGEFSNNRFIAITSGASMAPRQGVVLDGCFGVQVRGNHVRTGSSNTRPYTAFNLFANSSNNWLYNNQMSSGDNTSGLTKYINSGVSNLIVELGSFQTGIVIDSGNLHLQAGDEYLAVGRGVFWGAAGATGYILANSVGLRFSGLNGTEVRLSGNTLAPGTVDAVGIRGFSRFLGGAGTALAPALAYSSESSLGWYRSGVSTMALSYGTFNLATQAVRLSMRTLAASSVTLTAANTNVATNEVVFTVGGASGASLAIHSGGTVYIFNSALSAKIT